MTGLRCAQVEDLLGAYALDALPPDEARQVESHLEGCADHRREAAELSRVVPLLGLLSEEREPAPELRTRLLQRVAVTSIGPESGAHVGLTLTVHPAGRRRIPPLREWARGPVVAMAAVVVIALGVGVLIGRVFAPAATPTVTWTFTGNELAPAAVGRLVYVKNNHEAVLTVTGLPALKAGQVYEMWLIRNGTPIDAGVSAESAGKLGVQLSADPLQYQQLAITIEPGEQAQPTGHPILVGQLSRAST